MCVHLALDTADQHVLISILKYSMLQWANEKDYMPYVRG